MNLPITRERIEEMQRLAGAAINANNGRCPLIENVCLAVLSLCVDLLCDAEKEQAYSEEMHRQNDPHYFPDDPDIPEFDDEECESGEACPFCDGSGETTTAREGNGYISFDCPECGGTGWQ